MTEKWFATADFKDSMLNESVLTFHPSRIELVVTNIETETETDSKIVTCAITSQVGPTGFGSEVTHPEYTVKFVLLYIFCVTFRRDKSEKKKKG